MFKSLFRKLIGPERRRPSSSENVQVNNIEEGVDKKFVNLRRGKKISFKNPIGPIEVIIQDKDRDKTLLIINVQNDPEWNANYLLIDPEKFDPSNKKGYKEIRERERLIFSPKNSELKERFELSSNISFEFEIKLDGGILTIKNLNVENLRIGWYELRDPANEEIIQEIQKIRDKFENFVNEHREEIENILKNHEPFLNLARFFYDKFYNANISKSEGEYNDRYKLKVYEVVRSLLEKDEERKKISILDVPDTDWLYCIINEGVDRRKSIGKFYLNLKPEEITNFFGKAVRRFFERGLNIQIKIPKNGKPEILRRVDKVVIYFRPKEEKLVLEVLEELYNENSEAFNEGIPPFSLEVINRNNKVMNGIGFGEESFIPYTSFGWVRSEILAEVYIRARNDPNFSFKEVFKEAGFGAKNENRW